MASASNCFSCTLPWPTRARAASGEQPKSAAISACGKPGYQKQLAKELAAMGNSEMWRAGAATRGLRPKEPAKRVSKSTKGIAGRKTS